MSKGAIQGEVQWWKPGPRNANSLGGGCQYIGVFALETQKECSPTNIFISARQDDFGE